MEGINPWYGWWLIVTLSVALTLIGMALAYRGWKK